MGGIISPNHSEDVIISLRRLLLGPPNFHGGAYLPMDPIDNDPIQELAAPPKLYVPLTIAAGREVKPLVEPGQTVNAGMPIARADKYTWHAPRSGRVVNIGRNDYIASIEIETTQGESIKPIPQTPSGAMDWVSSGKADPFTLDELADLADDCGLDLADTLRQADTLRIDHVVINGLQPEPRCTSGPKLLKEHLESITAAGMIVRDTLKARRLRIAIDVAERALTRECRTIALGTPIRVMPLINKYPQAQPSILAWTITGIETPPGGTALNVGVLVLDPPELFDLWQAIRDRTPRTHRMITIGGPAASRPGHYRVPIGTRFADIIADVGLCRPLVRLVDGGPLTGQCIESLEAVVSRHTSTLLLIDREHDAIARPGPCIHCGACQEDCPVGLDPLKLLEAYELNRPQTVANLHPAACIECGLCSYVCPTELPLARATIHLKHISRQ